MSSLASAWPRCVPAPQLWASTSQSEHERVLDRVSISPTISKIISSSALWILTPRVVMDAELGLGIRS